MYLIIDDTYPRKVVKPITCYKTVFISPNKVKDHKNGTLAKFGETVKANIELLGYRIVRRGIFAYTDLKQFLAMPITTFERRVECIVPEGAIYYKGSYEHYNAIACNELIIIKELNDETVG